MQFVSQCILCIMYIAIMHIAYNLYCYAHWARITLQSHTSHTVLIVMHYIECELHHNHANCVQIVLQSCTLCTSCFTIPCGALDCVRNPIPISTKHQWQLLASYYQLWKKRKVLRWVCVSWYIIRKDNSYISLYWGLRTHNKNFWDFSMYPNYITGKN